MPWTEPDPKILDQLTMFGSHAADRAVVDAMFTETSVIPNPDGTKQRPTEAELTRIGVRAAIRMLVANGLLAITDPASQDDYIELDPPQEVS